MSHHPIVSQAAWLEARKALLVKEKEFTRQRDELTRQIRELPWSNVDKPYSFDTTEGKQSLSELFGSNSQLIIYHFMFDPEWDEGCKSCSYLADHYNPAVVHLANRDVSLVTVSRAPLEKLLAFQERMSWSFKWVSSYGSDFNQDFHVTFTPEQMAEGTTYYNYDIKPFPVAEAPGVSVFCKDEKGDVMHTYSTYGRGLDLFISAYNFLDIVPKGRNEGDFVYSMEWVRHHDRYGDKDFVDPYVEFMSESDEGSP